MLAGAYHLAQTPTSHSPGARFFAALDRKLKVERLRLEDVLGEYDRDGNSGLDERELGRLARNLMGEELSSLGVKYLMVGVVGRGEVGRTLGRAAFTFAASPMVS